MRNVEIIDDGNRLLRINRGGQHFEVIVQAETVDKFRQGKLDENDVVPIDTVFTNVSLGMKASHEELKAAFGTDDTLQVIETMLRDGEYQTTEAERQRQVDAKRREVISYIQKNYIAPDGHNLPISRIDNALEQVRFHADVNRDAEHQAEAVTSKLAEVMAMKRVMPDMEAIITVPLTMAPAVATALRHHGKVYREGYSDVAKFEVEVFNYDLLMKELNHATNGNYKFTITSSQAEGANTPATRAAHDKKGGNE